MRNVLILTALPVVLSALLAACGQGAAPGEGADAGGAPAARAGGDGAPVVKPGLWEVTTTSHFGLGDTVRLCMSDALDTDRTYLQTDAGEGCVAERKPLPGDGLHQITRCEAFGMKNTVDMTFTGGADAFETTGVIQMGDSQPVKSNRKARWVGPCPAGMQDGDAVEAG